MTIRVAINGFGRIGRNVLRALYENSYRDRIQVVAINDLGDPSLNSHLLRHDTVHGHFPFDVEHDAESIRVGGDRIAILSERDPSQLPWASMNIDLVMECTGLFTKREAAAKHIEAGAKRVLISAPSPDADATIVYGVNDDILTAEHTVVSNASCTTNCLAPVAKALNDAVGIENGLMTTVHAYTNDQNLSDVYHSDPYRARSATHSMIPTKTGAAAAVGLVLPELAGKFDGLAVRVPVINVSLVDLTFTASRDTSKEEINAIVEKAAANSSVLAVNAQPLVSIDFNHDAHSSTFDANHTRVNGRLVKIMAWYDNEWGFSNRMLDTALAMQKTAK
ncbi:type I glyceraldehyde-3-phosphate dehydrogenase [Vreelandella venusta]|uniref:type I glyceraldehyde-3-phosphate dehydrogenase n=1 Tax=Vreelandella venusta TaxID=44935 RepID=UPI003AA7B9A4